MKLKHQLPTACEIARLEFSIVRCKRVMRISEVIIMISAALLLLGLLNCCTLRVDPNGTRTWGTDPAAAAAIVNEIIDNK